MQCAECNITLDRGPRGYRVELEFLDPEDAALEPTFRGGAPLDAAALPDFVLKPDEYGRALGEQLFQDQEVRTAYIAGMAKARGVVRVRLWIRSDAAELQALRWELLIDPDGQRFGTSEHLLFSRLLFPERRAQPITLTPRRNLKALIAVAAPDDLERYKLSAIDRDKETALALDALAEINPVVVAAPVTLNRLVEELRGEYDVLYLVCHGALVREKPMARLFLENEASGVVAVSGAALAERLGDLARPPRLVVLASCESAGKRQGTDLEDRATVLASIVPRLVNAGIPAIVAMQGRIKKVTVEKMMPTFFRELLRDGRIDRALAAARGDVRDHFDHWMPALFSRLKEGRIWSQSETEEEALQEETPRVKARYFKAPQLPPEPYPVLLPYEHPALLAGRENETKKLIRQLEKQTPLILLSAASGMGKSSLLLGSLVPTLREESSRPVAKSREPQLPGLAARLISELLVSVELPEDGDGEAFVDRLEEAERLHGAPAVLVIDQFEEALRTDSAWARMGLLLAASVSRNAGRERPLCSWVLAVRKEAHGEVVRRLGNATERACDAGFAAEGFPQDLADSEQLAEINIYPLGSGGEAAVRQAFERAILQPLETGKYALEFAPGHAERLAKACARERKENPWAPLVPELQAVLAYLQQEFRVPPVGAGALEKGLIHVPEDVEKLLKDALKGHLRRALRAAFPHDHQRAERTRLLLALRGLATESGERLGRGVSKEEWMRLLGDDAEKTLQRLSGSAARLVTEIEIDDQVRFTLAHDRLAEVVTKAVEQAEQRGELDEKILELRPKVALKQALFASDPEASTRLERGQYRLLKVEANRKVLLSGEAGRTWWEACQRQRWKDFQVRSGLGLSGLLLLFLVAWFSSQFSKENTQQKTYQDRLVSGTVEQLPEAITFLTETISLDELVDLALQRKKSGEILEHGLDMFVDEQRNEIFWLAIERLIPRLKEKPQDFELMASMIWALERFASKNPAQKERILGFQERILAPLWEMYPPDLEAFDWVQIPAGHLWISAEGEENGSSNEDLRHKVEVNEFRILRYEVTNEQYRLLFSSHEGVDDLPVVNVSWYQAVVYAAWLGGRLPTERQWEYAARANCKNDYCDRKGQPAKSDAVAWTADNSGLELHPVGQLEPNLFGLHDMLGNAWEWASDWYAPYSPEFPIDPIGVPSGKGRVLRGGGFWDAPNWALPAARARVFPSYLSEDLSFRIVLPLGSSMQSLALEP